MKPYPSSHCSPFAFLSLILSVALSSALPLPKTASAAAPALDQIAFLRQDGLWVVNADGSQLRRVFPLRQPRLYDPKGGPYSEDLRVTCPPAWSPTGDRLCIGLNSAAALVEIDLRGRQLRKIGPLAYDKGTYEAFKMGGGRGYYIYFRNLIWPRPRGILAEYEEGDYRSNLMLWNGSQVSRIGDRGWRVRESTASKDGHWLAYGEDGGGLDHAIGSRQNLFLQDLVTNRRRKLYSTTLYPASDLSLAPDGSRVCFRRTAGDSGEERQLDRSLAGLWAVSRSGKLQQLTRDAQDAPSHVAPRWSPDGRWIAYVQGEDERGNPQGLYLFDLRVGRSRRLYEDPGFSYIWESDAHHVIVSRGLDGLWRVSVPGGKAKKITPDGFYPAVMRKQR